MTKKLLAFALVLLSGGCRMCSDCCDYAPVVPGGPPLGTSRSGSIHTSGAPLGQTLATPATAPPIETAN